MANKSVEQPHGLLSSKPYKFLPVCLFKGLSLRSAFKHRLPSRPVDGLSARENIQRKRFSGARGSDDRLTPLLMTASKASRLEEILA